MRPRPGLPSVRLGAGICIVDPQGRLLILQQSHAGQTDWGPPGGAVEHNESIEECAVREAFEETGLRVHLVRLISVDEFWHGGKFEGVGFNFLAEPDPWPQEVVPPEFDGAARFLDFRWVAIDEAPAFMPDNGWELWTTQWPADIQYTRVRRLDFPN
jgi:8-oxo-dGTP diphosphatase